MSHLFNIILLVIAGVGIVYLLNKKFANKKPKHIAVVDPLAQELYKQQKQKTDEKKILTLEEKIELSWQFLVHIKDQVLNNFSKPDQEKVHQAGHKLAESGMRYQHDVEQEIKITQGTSKAKTVNKSKDKDSASISR